MSDKKSGSRPVDREFFFAGYTVNAPDEKQMQSEEVWMASAFNHYIKGNHKFTELVEKVAATAENSEGPRSSIGWRHLRMNIHLKKDSSEVDLKRISRDFILAQISNSSLNVQFPFAFVENKKNSRVMKPDLNRWGDTVVYWVRHPELHAELLEPVWNYGERANGMQVPIKTQKENDGIEDGLTWGIVSALVQNKRYDKRLIDTATFAFGSENGFYLGNLLQYMSSVQAPDADLIFSRLSKKNRDVYRQWKTTAPKSP
ncbi:MAG: hypothetical protein U1E10_16015 [Bdellovibrionales bacterium]|nr:hypothetical protein [Bdellovibrionales bacterium]